MHRRMKLIMALTAALVATTGSAVASPTPAVNPDGARDGTVVVRDIVIEVPGQQDLHAWLVKPSGTARHDAAGVLWLHWLGEIHNDRGEYLAEAISLASSGVVSLLPQGDFPWVGDPVGDDRDVTAVRAQAEAYGAAFDHLRGLKAVDQKRIAVVGHDYGAMYGALAVAGIGTDDASADARKRKVTAMIMAAPDQLWGTWFGTFWLGLQGDELAEYSAIFAGLDPVDHVAPLGDRLYLQWAGDDFYIPESVRAAYAVANPDARVSVYPGVDHEFTTRAEVDRRAFLTARLDLG